MNTFIEKHLRFFILVIFVLLGICLGFIIDRFHQDLESKNPSCYLAHLGPIGEFEGMSTQQVYQVCKKT